MVTKSVTFNESQNQLKVLHVWIFAHHQARIGKWEEAARDRCRFKERIRKVGEVINNILSEKHRAEIYKVLYI